MYPFQNKKGYKFSPQIFYLFLKIITISNIYLSLNNYFLTLFVNYAKSNKYKRIDLHAAETLKNRSKNNFIVKARYQSFKAIKRQINAFTLVLRNKYDKTILRVML